MQAAIMKRPQSPAPSKNSGPRCAAGSYPQWMKTLEEKYQRLHKKITSNTMVTMGYPHLSGRTVYDVRLAKALAKYKDRSNNARRVASSPQSEPVINNQTADNGGQDEGAETPCLTSPGNPSPEREVTTLSGKATHFENPHGGSASDSQSDSVADDADDYDKSGRQAGIERELDGEDNGDNTDCDKTRSPDPVNPADKPVHYEVTNKQGSRNIRTSLSRTSRNTSKSCPAKIESQRPGGKTKATAHQVLERSKSAHKAPNKMFTKMSLEARHAITETIEEMNISRSKTAVVDNTEKRNGENVRFIPSRQRKCVKSWANHSKTDERKKRSKLTTNEIIEQASKMIKNSASPPVPAFMDRLSPEPDIDGDNHDAADLCSLQSRDSLSDVASSAQAQNNRKLLPEIPTEQQVRGKCSENSKHFIIPGIGKYDVQLQDTPFEITPPGFDSRYNDLQPFEERESETPPPDIRQQAVDKCSEWLTKYSQK